MRIQAQQIEALIVSAQGAQARLAEPGFDARSAERRVNQAERHRHRFLQLAREVITGRRKISDGVRLGGLPGNRRLKMLQRRRAAGVGNGQNADQIIGGAGNFARGVQRSRNRQLHVRLAGAQPHIAHQQVGDCLARAGLRTYRQYIRTAGRHGGERSAPVTGCVGTRADGAGGDRDGHAIARCGFAPDRDWPVALQYGVIHKHVGQ